MPYCTLLFQNFHQTGFKGFKKHFSEINENQEASLLFAISQKTTRMILGI